MTTVAELIDYLTTLPPDTEIEVLERYHCHYETSTRWVALELGPYSGTMDLITWPAEARGAYAGKTVLFLGEE